MIVIVWTTKEQIKQILDAFIVRIDEIKVRQKAMKKHLEQNE